METWPDEGTATVTRLGIAPWELEDCQLSMEVVGRVLPAGNTLKYPAGALDPA